MKRLDNFNPALKGDPFYFMLFKFDENHYDDDADFESCYWEYGDGVTSESRIGNLDVELKFPDFHRNCDSQNHSASIHDNLLTLISLEIVEDTYFKEIKIYCYYEDDSEVHEILHFKNLEEAKEWRTNNS